VAVGKVTNGSIAKLDGWLWCDKLVGFGARRQRGAVFFYVRYRINGSQVVRSIGRNGHWTCDTARNEAKRLLGIVATGIDPHAQLLSAETFGGVVDRYLDRRRSSLKPRSFIEVERYLRNYSAPLHRLRLGEINRAKIAALLAEIETSSGPASRNRARAALSSLWSWAIQEGLVDVSPVTGTGKADEVGSRERVLTQAELRKLCAALDDGRFSNIVRLLLLTGARRNEIGHLQWSEIDLARKLIVLPPERTKNGKAFELPLSRQALAIIERIPRRNSSDFLFSDVQGFKDWGGAKMKLDAHAGIAEWTLHDLRRTCATNLAELGVQPHHIEAILNHLSGHKASVAGIYNRAKYADEMRSALQRWADHLDQITA
jgi:integrase